MPKGKSGIKNKSEDVTFSNEKIIYPYNKDEIVKELQRSPAGTSFAFTVNGSYVSYTVEEKDGQKVYENWDRYEPINKESLSYMLNNSEVATIRYHDNKGRMTEEKDFASFKARPGADRVRITMRQEVQSFDDDNFRTANKVLEREQDIFVYKKIPVGFERTDIVYIDSKTNNKYRRFRGPAEPGKRRMLNVYKREI